MPLRHVDDAFDLAMGIAGYGIGQAASLFPLAVMFDIGTCEVRVTR